MPAGRGHYTGDGQRCDCLWRGPFRPIRAAAADSEPVPHLRADGGVHPFSCFVCERCFGLLDAQVSYTICAAFPSNSHTRDDDVPLQLGDVWSGGAHFTMPTVEAVPANR